MKSFLATVRDGSGPERVDRTVRLLEEEWRGGGVEIDGLLVRARALAAHGTGSAGELLAELVRADIKRRFEVGEHPRVADYLSRLPELRSIKDRVVSLIYEEYCLLEERGVAPDLDSFCDPYSEWKDSLVSQLEYHRLFSQAGVTRTAAPRFPQAGEEFEEFELITLIGEGGASRVFVARDHSLGGKQVVLKISLDRGDEPKLQGRLDHPRIVPVHSVTFAPDRGLVGLKMPYQIGLSLDAILARLKQGPGSARARDLWRVLVEGAVGRLIPGSSEAHEAILRQELLRTGPRGDGWTGFPIRQSYERGVAWLGLAMAQALEYAHSMHTFHRDVKPANVLISLDRGPQLLDFNLAESGCWPDQAHKVLRGGTPPYMAPEQLLAFINPEGWSKVGAAADVYSLGLVLREMLTGQSPEPPPAYTSSPPLALLELYDRCLHLVVSPRRFNPRVPHALDAIVSKALAVAPAERYPTAAALALDLQRFLERKPLVHAVNPSQRERLFDWSVRRRRALALSGCLAVVLAVAAYRPLATFLRPRLDSLPEFQNAELAVEQGQGGKILDRLADLETRYPSSSIVKLLLSLALDASHRSYDAETYFRAALAQPDLETDLVPFAASHPELALKIGEFAADRFDIPYSEDVDLAAQQTPYSFYELALDALKIAEQINPDSPRIQRRLARVETLLGRYEQARARLTRTLERAGGPLQSIFESEWPASLNETYYSRQLRGWVATTYVERERARLLETPGAALAIMEKAREDIDFCSRFIRNWHFEDQPLKEFLLWRDEIHCYLTLGELEIELGLRAQAENHLQRARSLMPRFLEHSRGLGHPYPGRVQLSHRLDLARLKLNTSKIVKDSLENAAKYSEGAWIGTPTEKISSLN